MSAATPALALALLATGAVKPGPPPSEAPASFAVIVAHNRSFDDSLAPLRFADDDGARYAELLGLSAERVELLTVMDGDTQRLHPALARTARVPTRAQLEGALARTFTAIRAADRQGRRTVLYFVYVGHGSVGDSGEGVVHLADGSFSRSDLFQTVLAPSPATVNHVIIDACHAYLMVARRGGQDRTEAALEAFLQKESLDAHPNTGVLLSTSAAKEVHEWARFSAGIFSHELRSALAGGADIDADGEVGYAEARAFIAAANARVDNPMARLEVYSKPPAVHLDEPLFARAWAPRAPVLEIPPERHGRWYVEDERGIRYADFHSAASETVRLTLVPQPRYFLRDGRGKEIEIPLAVHRRVDAGALEVKDQTLALRGSEAVTFQRDLFALPFGRAYFEGFKAATLPAPSQRVLTERAPPSGLSGRDWGAFGLGVAGVASALTGLGFALSADGKASDYRSFVGDDDDLEDLRRSAEADTTAAQVLIGTGAGLLAGALTLWLWPD